MILWDHCCICGLWLKRRYVAHDCIIIIIIIIIIIKFYLLLVMNVRNAISSEK